MAVAAPDGGRVDPARSLLRRLDSVAREVRPADGGCLACLAGAGVARHLLRACCACARPDRPALDSPRLCPYARPVARGGAARPRRRGDPRGCQHARRLEAFPWPLGRIQCPTATTSSTIPST